MKTTIKTYEDVTVLVSNIAGQVIESINYNNISKANIYLNGNAGFYFVEIITPAGKTTLKVLKK